MRQHDSIRAVALFAISTLQARAQMPFDKNGEKLETSRENGATRALKRLEELGRVPMRFITTFILVTGHDHSWRKRAKELDVSPGTIGYQLRQVRLALEHLLREEPELY